MAPEVLVARLERLVKQAEHAALDEWLTVAQAADLTKFSKDFFYDNADDLPFMYRVGRELRASRDGLAKWMRAHKTN